MQTINDIPFTYIHVVCEAKLHPTEDRSKVEDILYKFLSGTIETDERFDGTYLLIKTEGTEALQLIHEWVSIQKIIDTVRSRFYNSITGNVTAAYFNRQAAYMNHLSLIDLEDGTPMGPISFQLISDNLLEILDIVTPRTYDGKIMTAEEKAKHFARIEKKKELKRKEKQRNLERDRKFILEDD